MVESLRHEEALVGKSGGFFVAGKFNEIPSPTPCSALVDALTDLCDEILKHDDLDTIRAALRESLSEEDPETLTNVIPSFGKVFGDSSDYVTRVSFRKEFGFERVKKALNLFLACVCSESRPVVLFIDDLQWTSSDNASLEIIESLLVDVELVNKGLLIILAYRDNEIDEDHPLHGILNRIHASDSAVHATEIRLKNLDAGSLKNLVAMVTQVDASETKPLADIVCQMTGRNPFYSIQFLMMLQEKGLLFLSPSTFKCEWNLERIQAEMSVSDNVVDFMACKIDRLPLACKGILEVASCLGMQFDSSLIAAILDEERTLSEQTEIDTSGNSEESLRKALAFALNDGLI